jgi:hypothetical protein
VAATQAVVHNTSSDEAKGAFSPAASTTSRGASPSPTATAACPVAIPPDATNEAYTATAVLEGRSVQVDVFTLADGSLTLVVTDLGTCAQVFSQPV